MDRYYCARKRTAMSSGLKIAQRQPRRDVPLSAAAGFRSDAAEFQLLSDLLACIAKEFETKRGRLVPAFTKGFIERVKQLRPEQLDTQVCPGADPLLPRVHSNANYIMYMRIHASKNWTTWFPGRRLSYFAGAERQICSAKMNACFLSPPLAQRPFLRPAFTRDRQTKATSGAQMEARS